MTMIGSSRRDFVASMSAAVILAAIPTHATLTGESEMYGLIGKMNVVPGQRDALIATLIEGGSGMPGCLSYVVAQDATDADAIWITEVWDSEASHQASLTLPSVKAAIAKGRPMIAGFGERFATRPVGGHGFAASG
jgi:quinol monooxygenase YgiN